MSMPPDDDRPDADAAGPAAPPATATPDTDTDTTPEPEIGAVWHTFPLPERRAVLDARLAEWRDMSDHGKLLGPFDRDGWQSYLTGADVYYLAARSLVRHNGNIAEGLADVDNPNVSLSALHLEHADLFDAHLEFANLSEAHLESADLREVRLERASLSFAHLEHADLGAGHLKHASLLGAYLEHINLLGAYLEHADLRRAHLEHANIRFARLEHALLDKAHLEHSCLQSAYLDHTSLDSAWLAGADLRSTFLDVGTSLTNATMTDADHGSVRVADVRWQGMNLAVVKEWPANMVLGDEQAAWKLARELLPKAKTRKQRREAIKKRRDEVREAFRAAARANRQLAAVMRDQGMNDEADHFAYRAQVVQRELHRRQGRRARWFGSLLLDLVSGYGYKPIRSVFTYAAVIFVFAAAFFLLGASGGTHTLTWNEALVVSVTAFHGRGFFATAFQPGDPQAVVAAVEAIIGLLIEITFIATFTQRFFGK